MAAKKVLLAINTMGQGGAETALIALLQALARRTDWELHLLVLLGQGELIRRVPSSVRLLNRHYDPRDVLSAGGRRAMYGHVLRLLAARLSGIRNLPYMLKNYGDMRRAGTGNPKTLLWKAVSDGTAVPGETYDLAIAYLEGAATYFVADRVKARKKAAFLHSDYGMAGYTPGLDHGCYSRFDRVFCVSEDVKASFLAVYPGLTDRTALFRNFLDPASILRRSEEGSGFDDGYVGVRILSLGRLTKVKAFDLAVAAAKRLRDRGWDFRWTVFGEGEERPRLEREIRSAGLEDAFFLPGAVENPFPYLRQGQIYVQCSRFEGQSLAVREAKVLGLPVVLTRSSGNREQITDGVDGIFVEGDPASLADGIERLLKDAALRARLGAAAAAGRQEQGDLDQLLELVKE